MAYRCRISAGRMICAFLETVVLIQGRLLSYLTGVNRSLSTGRGNCLESFAHRFSPRSGALNLAVGFNLVFIQNWSIYGQSERPRPKFVMFASLARE
jgi:hypothetical protein